MADHDLGAELTGYRSELEHCQALGKDERAAAVRAEIERVEGEVREAADGLERAAAGHQDAGQDVLAAQARVRARQYRELLGDPQDGQEDKKPARRGGGRARKETAEDKTPRERA